MKSYTNEQKQVLIRRFEQQRHERRTNLISEMQKMGQIFEAKIIRRTHLVPKKFSELKIKDVLAVERERKIKLFELIQQVNQLKEQALGSADNQESLYKEMQRIRTHRKQSLAANRIAKVSK